MWSLEIQSKLYRGLVGPFHVKCFDLQKELKLAEILSSWTVFWGLGKNVYTLSILID